MPTLRGWIAILLVGTGLALVLLFGTYPFLAVSDPKPGGVLVVEGWASEEVMKRVIAEFQRNHYERIYCTGVPIDASSPLAQYGTYAEYGAMLLVRLGCNPAEVDAVPTPVAVRDRTYSSAVALKRLLKEHGLQAKPVNLFSMGVHSRRSRLLFQKAFGDDPVVGVVTTGEVDFDPRRWWVSSAGFRNVTSEVMAYLYARFLFSPPAE